MHATDLVQAFDERHRRQRLAIHGYGIAGLEADLDVLRPVGCVLGRVCQHVDVGRRLPRRVLDRTALMRHVPEVAIAREDLLLADRQCEATRFGVRDRVFPRMDVPFTPWCDDFEIGGESRERKLEADLVVPLPRAAMRERVSAERDAQLRLAARNDRPRHGGAEQILARVDRACSQRREDRLAHELVAQILHDQRLRALLPCALLEAGELLTLTDVGRHADHVGVVVLTQPRHDDGRVQAARVRQHHSERHQLLPRLENAGATARTTAISSQACFFGHAMQSAATFSGSALSTVVEKPRR